MDRWFLDGELDLSDLAVVQGVADPFEKLIWWRYKRQDGTKRLLGYDWQLDRWFASDVAVSHLMSMLTPGVTWDGLDDLYSSIDEVDVPFDSRIFDGGRPLFAGFTLDNRLAYFSGPSLEATVETGDAELMQGTRAFITGARIITNAPTCELEVATSDYHGAVRAWKAATSPSTVTGIAPARANGRLHRFRVTIPAGTNWSHLHGVEPRALPGGAR